ncbi:kinesin-like protein [Acrasis kona]|uniref:Kinesin-like protein n=1 Tax=Acrasis kona TaxID=1008807 RepID=A0AAW2Z332_9EUKA
MSTERVRVALRARPLLSRDIGEDIIRCDNKSSSVELSNHGECFYYDHVFGPETKQSVVFNTCVSPILESWIEGYNGCILAYGQTGSGKTYTMIGDEGGKGTEKSGIIPAVAEKLFIIIQKEQQQFAILMGQDCESQFQVRVSFVEVYKDDVYELLGQKEKSTLALREQSGKVFVSGAVERIVNSTRDVKKAIQDGTNKRVTGQTSVHEYSSRSHACFTIVLEHRWCNNKHDANNKNMNKKVSSLTFVDLAGSEQSSANQGINGVRFSEGVSINMGLLALGNVIESLSQNKSNASHVPYRDSTLTRLLQNSLGGNSKTLMITCVSPGAGDKEQTLSTLKYASNTRSIKNAPKTTITQVEREYDPDRDDIADPDDQTNRRSIWIDTSKNGEIFARTLGNPSLPLILLVHGSGPTNSSTYWNSLIFELFARTAGTGEAYYYVAIDCPGYGRSIGDRQTIRSYPGDLLKDIIHSLGKERAHCLIGSSQGSASVFNATLEYPNITDYLVVVDPVAHDTQRFVRVTQPTLLMFDIDDDGHPVKIGRRMKSYLPCNVYHEFSSKKDPFWPSDHYAVEILKLFSVYKSNKMIRELEAIIPRLATGMLGWADYAGYGEPIKEFSVGALRPLNNKDEKTVTFAPKSNLSKSACYRAEACMNTGRIYYVHVDTGERVGKLPQGAVCEQQSLTTQSHRIIQVDSDLFLSEDVEMNENDLMDIESEEERQSREHAETKCCMCQDLLWLPVRLPECRHVMCYDCYLRSNKYQPACCVCDSPVKNCSKLVVDELHQIIIIQNNPDLAIERPQRINHLNLARNKYTRFILEYGNTATPARGGAFAVKAFARVLNEERGKIGKNNIISQVHFDINPEYPKSAVKVLQSPFELERTMAEKFPCNMTVVWNKSLHWPPLEIPYTIQHEQKQFIRKIIVLVGEEVKKSKTNEKKKIIVYKPTPFTEVYLT